MRAVRRVLDFLALGGTQYIFGIPAGSVNAFFDELYTMPEITPIVAKHEGAAAYMAAAYAKYSGKIGICIGSSGPGSTNFLSGAANAMREQLPVLFLTGAVPTNTVGMNASQELDAEPIFSSVTKYSITVKQAEDLVKEVTKAVKIALAGVPGPVHIAMPIDLQLKEVAGKDIDRVFPCPHIEFPDPENVKSVAAELVRQESGCIFVGQGARESGSELIEIAEILNWPIIRSPQAKGLISDFHPLSKGIYGFAGHESASQLVNDEKRKAILIVGSSLGETATNNYNPQLTDGRVVIQIDRDGSVFDRKYPVDLSILGDVQESLKMLINELYSHGLKRNCHSYEPVSNEEYSNDYNTQNVLKALQRYLPSSMSYSVDIGEFMSYVIHYMKVFEPNTFDLNVHFGAMGTSIGTAIGISLASSPEHLACITGDGCFFMHGMEILTAKEYKLPILFIVMNNSRLGMVYHGHALQYKRVHARFEQQPVNIAEVARAMGIPSLRIEKMADIQEESLAALLNEKGPAVLEISLVDNNIPPMGDRVKFLSSFGK